VDNGYNPAVGIAAVKSVRYPDHYSWLVFVAALDAMLTYVVLSLGGREVNALANAILHWAGWHGMVVYKFVLIVFVIVLCEVIGRRDDTWGRRLGVIGIGITWVPIVLAFVLLATKLARF
jgi:hypothetical protein